jgi:subtilase family serine protease
VRQRLKVLAALPLLALLAACSSSGAGTSILASPVGAAPIAGGSIGLNSIGHFLAPNEREACPHLGVPGMAYCDLVVHTDAFSKTYRPNVSGLGPPDFIAAYNLPSASMGSGQTVAIVDAFSNPSAEYSMNVYRAQFGIPPCEEKTGCLQIVNQAGNKKPIPPCGNPCAGGWSFEIALDIEMVSASCPNCNIILVEANDNSFLNLGAGVRAAVKLGANVISNSYSGSGANGFERFYFYPGHVILASAGDAGYQGPSVNPEPAGYPHVVSVGGTFLQKGGSGRGWTENVWFGTGSACTSFKKQKWQKDAGCPGRMMNDVAAVAENAAIYDKFDGGWGTVAGTSISSPLLGGVYGLAGNASHLWSSKTLYEHPGALYDITSGGNGNCSPNPAYWCNGEVGYDGPTGNGVPNGIGAF